MAVKSSSDNARRKESKSGKKGTPKLQRPAPKPAGKAAAAAVVSPPPVKKPQHHDAGAVTPKPVEKPAGKLVVKPAVKPPEKPAGKSLHDNAPSPALTEDDLRKVKTGLSRKDLEHYRQLLLHKRAEILGDVDSLQTDRDSKNPGGGNLSNMPLHMADVGTENYEQEFTLHLVESERALLREINDALMRIRNGTFGVCLESGVPINRARLDAKPWARYSIEISREKERMRLPS